jgi:perosamine synthetase
MLVGRMLPPVTSHIDATTLRHAVCASYRANEYGRVVDAELRRYLGAQYVFKVSSGKAALVLILRALSRLSPERNQVIIPAYTCYSVPASVVKAGLRPVLCDIVYENLGYDLDLLRELIGPQTLCVVSCDLFGMRGNGDEFATLCAEHGSPVVEDAAQAMGIELDGRKLGLSGDVGFFSLGRGKNVSCGGGGIVVTRSDKLGRALAIEHDGLDAQRTGENVRVYLSLLAQKAFSSRQLFWIPSAIPQLKVGETLYEEDFPVEKLASVSVGALRTSMSRLEQSNLVRRANSHFFATQLKLERCGTQAVPYLRFPVLMRSKDLKARLLALPGAKCLGLSGMYPKSLDELPELAEFVDDRTFRVARDIAQRLVTIPTHALVREEDRVAICQLIESVY